MRYATYVVAAAGLTGLVGCQLTATGTVDVAGGATGGAGAAAKWRSEPLSWTAKAPAGARVGEPIKLEASATLGSSSCTRLVSATAKADEATKTVVLAGTLERAPGTMSCTRDMVVARPPLSFTPKTAGTWRLTGPGFEAIAFEVAPAGTGGAQGGTGGAQGGTQAARVVSLDHLDGAWDEAPNANPQATTHGIPVPAKGVAKVDGCRELDGLWSLTSEGQVVTARYSWRYAGGAAISAGMVVGGDLTYRGERQGDKLVLAFVEKKDVIAFGAAPGSPSPSPSPSASPSPWVLTFDAATQHLLSERAGQPLRLVPLEVQAPATPCPSLPPPP